MQLYIFLKKKKEMRKAWNHTKNKTKNKLSTEHIWSQPKNIFFVI